jgi:hypothetical protein
VHRVPIFITEKTMVEMFKLLKTCINKLLTKPTIKKEKKGGIYFPKTHSIGSICQLGRMEGVPSEGHVCN